LHTGWFSGVIHRLHGVRVLAHRPVAHLVPAGVIAVGKLRVKAGKRVGRPFLHRLARRAGNQLAARLIDTGLRHRFADNFLGDGLRLVRTGLHGGLGLAPSVGLRHPAHLQDVLSGAPSRERRR
jgi:hypothetical protein